MSKNKHNIKKCLTQINKLTNKANYKILANYCNLQANTIQTLKATTYTHTYIKFIKTHIANLLLSKTPHTQIKHQTLILFTYNLDKIIPIINHNKYITILAIQYKHKLIKPQYLKLILQEETIIKLLLRTSKILTTQINKLINAIKAIKNENKRPI